MIFRGIITPSLFAVFVAVPLLSHFGEINALGHVVAGSGSLSFPLALADISLGAFPNGFNCVSFLLRREISNI